MNKRTYYGIIGILIALIVVFVAWGVVKSSQPSQTDPSVETPTGIHDSTESGETAGSSHAGMNHGSTGISAAETDSGSKDPSYAGYMEDQDTIMSRMMQDMELTEDTGNSALDFIAGMVPHHAAAIDMAESYLKHGGEHKELKPLAQNIITTQRDEITEMEGLYQEISSSAKKDQAQADAYREAYQKMMTGHHGHDMGVSTRTSIDTAFAEGMLMHHQMAVDMAKDILEYTDETAVLELAQQIIDTQEEEIKVMQDILNDH